MIYEEIDLLLDSLNIGREYIEEAIQKEEAEFEGYIQLSRCHLMKLDLAEVENTIEWLEKERTEVWHNRP